MNNFPVAIAGAGAVTDGGWRRSGWSGIGKIGRLIEGVVPGPPPRDYVNVEGGKFGGILLDFFHVDTIGRR